MDYKKHLSSLIRLEGVSESEIENALEVPPNKELGDFALPCFKFSGKLRLSPIAIASKIVENFTYDDFIESASAVKGYVNFYVNRRIFCNSVLTEIAEKGEYYGSCDIGKGKTICIDYSSINIAKQFHIGHLLTTVLGGALYRIFKYLGYNAIGINHLGDYGTQFGKLIVAYKQWGNRETVEKLGLKELTRLYVKFHEEAEKNPDLDEQAREYFKKIERGDKESNELFEWFKALTMKEVNAIYARLDITFDSYAGESFYNDKLQAVIDELNEKGLLVESEGAKVVMLDEYNMPPCIITKSDGASLYVTRDLAAAMYRKKTYDFYKCLYVVAYQQNLHFQQLFKVLELMGKDWAKDMEHVAFGMVSLEDGAMSTRHGKVVLLEDLINRCVEKSYKIIEEKNPELDNKEQIAEMVGTGAVIFGALSNNKIKDTVFSYDKALNFEGETCVYVQYTAARCKSVLRRAGELKPLNMTELLPCEYELISLLDKFGSTVAAAAEKREPCYISRYVLDVAHAFSKFYLECKIICEDENCSNTRKHITKATLSVLTSALKLLGIKIPEKM